MRRSLSPHAPNQIAPDKEQALFALALEEFQKKGVDNATMDDIARKAGVSKGTIYRRFSGKEELFRSVVRSRSEALAIELADFELDSADIRGSLTLAAERIREISVENVDFQRLLIAEAPRREKISQDARNRMNRQLIVKLTEFFNQLIQQEKMDDLDVDHLVWTFFILSVGGRRVFFNITKPGYLKKDASRLKFDLELFIKGCGIQA